MNKVIQPNLKLTFSILLVMLIFSLLYVKAQSGESIPVDLRSEREDIFIFYDAPAGSATTGEPLAIGDLNSNGCGDIVVAGQNASFGRPEGWRNNAGHLRIIMDLCSISGQIDMANPLDTSNPIITIFGARSDDMLGTEISIGDFNADGFDDVLVGAQNHDGIDNDRPNAGAAYLILGSRTFDELSDIDLLNPTDNIIRLFGADAEDRLGIWVDHGDVDADGYVDMLIGANQADGLDNSRINSGEVWVIYGGNDLINQYGFFIDLRNPSNDTTRIIGVDYDDLFGSTILGADLNNDGYSDVIASAALWRGSAGIGGVDFGGGDGPNNSRYNSGDTYIIFGGSQLRGITIDLAIKLDDIGNPIDESIAIVYGADANDLMGEELAAGDLDGDGRNDLVLGSLVTAGLNNTMDEAGEAWILYGTESFEGRAIDLAEPNFDTMVVVYPDQPSSKGGDILRVADLDNDGIADLFYGAPNYDPTGNDSSIRQNAGMLAIIYGVAGGHIHEQAIVIPFGVSEDVRISYVIGADSEDMMAYGLAIYDVNNDGIFDVAPNGMGGDGADNQQVNSGEIYVIDGSTFISQFKTSN